MGNRLGKYTENNTKCMVEVCGKTLIQRAIDALKKYGITKIVVVVGYKHESLESHVKEIDGIESEFIFNKDYDKTNNIYSLYLARDCLLGDDTVLVESDLIFDDSIMGRLVRSEGTVATVDKYSYWMDGTVTIADGDGTIVEFIEKKDMDGDRLNEYNKTVNIYKLTKEFSKKYLVPEMDGYIRKNGRNAYYELVLKALSDISGSRLKAMRIEEGERWYEIDDPKDLDVARTMFSDSDAMASYSRRYGGFWRFPQILDFCYLVNPYFPPKLMISEISSITEELLTSYPSGMDVQCLNAGVTFGIDPKNILVGNGATELINGMDEFVGRAVGVCVPTFEEYVRCFRHSEIKQIDVSETNYLMNEGRMMSALENVDTLVIISPNNPCADVLSFDTVIRIINKAKEFRKKVIFDESFIDFMDVPYTLVDQRILDEYPNLVVIKSISKSYGVPGLRLGILATSDTALINCLRKKMPVWNINSFGDVFLQIIGKYGDRYQEGCELLRKERRRFTERLSEIPGLRVYPSQANYLFCRLENITAGDLARRLLNDHGVLIKDLTGKSGIRDDRHIRIGIRGERDNDRFADALLDVLSGR
ncbi:MAG: aminotransferase class I/II-fold pyridoxal phosphate-dependent enzyme [Methanomassiliicoccaceae archaeon]|nr:aminotransferase class I/II-fold pyridoxal phosphate-dependent enzyme [Methanomassiliicoccaceae archaeon]